jgi:hypothetical protein
MAYSGRNTPECPVWAVFQSCRGQALRAELSHEPTFSGKLVKERLGVREVESARVRTLECKT